MFIKVLLPLKLDWTPSYSSGTNVREGARVQVRFGFKKYIGVVLGPDDAPSVATDKILPIDGLAEGLPDITSKELRFWEFLSSYYMCTLGEVYKAVYPQGRTESEFIGARKAAGKGTGQEIGTKQAQQTLPSCPEVIIAPDRTDEYISEAEAAISEGRDALVLVPEFRLAAGLQKKLRKKFGDKLLCFNSKMTVAQRRKVSEALRSGSNPVVVLGTRSAIFLPFNGLGLIIVDEEQDAAYKQTDPAPRFNARDAATVLAGIHNSRIILGTSCPSFETLLNLQSEKYSLLTVCRGSSRIRVIDITAEKKKRGIRGDITYKLEEEIRSAKGKIAIVRGWEKEEELRLQLDESFPDIKIELLRPSEALVSLTRYSLTAVLQADALFDKSDFRSDERVLQALSRLACRTDNLVIQTARAAHPVFQLLQDKGISAPLLEERKLFNLPPYSRLVDTAISDRNPTRLKKFAALLSNVQKEAQKIETEACVRFRTTLPRTSEAAKKKEAMMQSIRYMEKNYNYSGHIHFDVDPI